MDSIQAFIHRKVIVLRQSASVYEASRAMCENNVGCVVVSDGEGHITGLVTDRDVACAVVSLNQTPDTELVEIMTSDPATVSESAALSDVIALMKDRGVRRIPVVHQFHSGRGERCVGMISLDDLIVARQISSDDLAQVVRSQVYRRRRGRPKTAPQWTAATLHNEKSTDRFMRLVEERTALSEQKAAIFVSLVFGLIVRLIHFTSAAELISRLPEQLRAQLLDLPAGPDRAITPERIVRDISDRFDVSQDVSRQWLLALWDSLAESLPEGVEAEIAEEIPPNVRTLFIALPVGDQDTSRDALVRSAHASPSEQTKRS